MNYLEIQTYIRRYKCASCGNLLSYQKIGEDDYEARCPGNPSHREFTKQLGYWDEIEKLEKEG